MKTTENSYLLYCVFTAALVVFSISIAQTNKTSEKNVGNKWESAVKEFEQWDEKNSFPKDAVLFIGSSSIRWWKTAVHFDPLPVINRGFGGATISDINFFYKRIVMPYRPKIIVFYCGGNDLLSAGKSPEQVFQDYKKFTVTLKKTLPETRLLFMSVKPGPAHSDEHSLQIINKLNEMVERFSGKEKNLYYMDVSTGMLNEQGMPDPLDYQADGVHLTYKADKKWAELLKPKLMELYYKTD